MQNSYRNFLAGLARYDKALAHLNNGAVGENQSQTLPSSTDDIRQAFQAITQRPSKNGSGGAGVSPVGNGQTAIV